MRISCDTWSLKMYGVYQQLKALVLGEEQEEEREKEGKKENQAQVKPSPVPKIQKRCFTGEITSLSDTSGMIDQQVVFTPKVVMGNRTAQVGSMAHVMAERPHPLACWKATRVEITDVWDYNDIEERKTIIGFIAQITRRLAVVDCATAEVTFDPQCFTGPGYGFETGDWVTMVMRWRVEERDEEEGGEDGEEEEEGDWEEEEEERGEEEVESVRPLREKEVEGRVTSVGRSFGFVDEDIVFSFGLCGRGSQVRVGDEVRVKCVEHRHHTAAWRAVSMTTMSSRPHCVPSPPAHSPTLPLISSPLPSMSFEGLMKNKNGLEINEMNDLEEDLALGGEKSITFTIRNMRSHDTCLMAVKPLPHDPQISVFLPHSLLCTCDILYEERRDEEKVKKEEEEEEKKEEEVEKEKEEDVEEEEEEEEEDKGRGESNELSIKCESRSSESGEGGEVGDDVKELRGMQVAVGVVSDPHIHISRGGSIDISVAVRPRSLGTISCLLLFSFLGGVKIARRLRSKVTSSELECLQPSSTYRGRGGGGGGRWRGQGRVNGVIPGEKPQRRKLLKLPRRLKAYPVPEDLAEGVWEGDESEILSLRPQLTEPLCMKNHYSRFSSLLHLEEIQREIDMRAFDLHSVPLRPDREYLSLDVPELSEGRPSLVMGDRVVVSVSREEVEDEVEDEVEGWRGRRDRYWEGYIHEIRRETILLKFAKEFHQSCYLHKYDVIFQFSRTSFRRMHHAVENSHLLGSKVLFPGQPSPKQPLIRLTLSNYAPSGNHDDTPVSIPRHQLFNPVLNPRQVSAVVRILAGQGRPAPYVVFGPPGTGKTVTLVEAILQIYKRSRASRVLACTPSNSAADLIMERLLGSGELREGEIVRLNAIQRAEPPLSIAAHCMNTDSADIAVRCRVVVCTCMTAGVLHSLSLPVGHFTHVLVDEAGQATEPEALLPASLLSATNGQLVLAGDPHQLGPVLSSRMAGSLGLSLSLLERIMSRQPYLRDPDKYSDHGSYDPLLVTKLVENYRSHCSILNLYSDTFYHGELEPCADPAVASLMCDWEGLPREGFPLLFHGVVGEDMREGSSPSWYNPVEIIQVVSYIQSLIDNSTYAPKLSDIGIISPYKKQVEKIRWFLSRMGVEGIKVGSVEEFQGQERLVIILSTVRSTVDLVTSDCRHHLGFLGNPKRFNVAISRAQALLIVVGNPHLLCQDPHWKVLVQYAVDNRSYTGCPLPSSVATPDNNDDPLSSSTDPDLD